MSTPAQSAARYALVDPSKGERVVVSASRKVSFCLSDSARLPQRCRTFRYGEHCGNCAKRSPQGDHGRPDRPQLDESDNDNDRAVRAIVIRGNRVEPRPASRCR